MTIAWHIMLALEDRRIILREPKTRLAYARAVTRIGAAYGLLCHSMPDDHEWTNNISGVGDFTGANAERYEKATRRILNWQFLGESAHDEPRLRMLTAGLRLSRTAFAAYSAAARVSVPISAKMPATTSSRSARAACSKVLETTGAAFVPDTRKIS